MREIVLDTETTGLDPRTGDRIVEIGCVELVNHMPTGRTFHTYVNPQRSMPAEAYAVHGLSEEFLSDKPVFAQIAGAFIDFIAGARLVIHNAAFDIAFIKHEIARLEGPAAPITTDQAVDTLELARRRHPFGPNSLDALCRRYGIDNANRTLHGALLDCQLLAEVYLELIGGRQPALHLGMGGGAGETAGPTAPRAPARQRPQALGPRLAAADLAAHAAFVATLGDKALWIEIEGAPAAPETLPLLGHSQD